MNEPTHGQIAEWLREAAMLFEQDHRKRAAGYYRKRAAYVEAMGESKPIFTMEQPQRVCITWKNPRHDWPWYRLLGSLGELVHLQGADYPDGRVKHRGDSFWVHFSEIESMVDA